MTPTPKIFIFRLWFQLYRCLISKSNAGLYWPPSTNKLKSTEEYPFVVLEFCGWIYLLLTNLEKENVLFEQMRRSWLVQGDSFVFWKESKKNFHFSHLILYMNGTPGPIKRKRIFLFIFLYGKQMKNYNLLFYNMKSKKKHFFIIFYFCEGQ